jgi:hypothetical protein
MHAVVSANEVAAADGGDGGFVTAVAVARVLKQRQQRRQLEAGLRQRHALQ